MRALTTAVAIGLLVIAQPFATSAQPAHAPW
jgi:hypothetical protein